MKNARANHQATGKANRTGHSKPTPVSSTHQPDIDGLKRPLEDLAVRERQWRAALDLVPVVLIQLDSSLQIVAVNKCGADLFSRPLHRLVQRDAVSLLCADGSDEERELRELTAKLVYAETEIFSTPLDRWLSVAFYPVPAARGGLEAALLRLLDITSRKRTEEKLHRSINGLRQLAARLQSIREEERARISREIHDELGHQLTGLSLNLGWLRGRLQSDGNDLVGRVDGMLSMVDGTMRSVRRISTDLRPAVLDHLGLAAAIRWQCNEFRQRTRAGVVIELEPSLWKVTPQVSTALFRILQEALTNVARHAGAEHVMVALRTWEDHLLMSVEDDGRGFDLGELSDHHCGLFGMEQRAVDLGGQFWVESELGRGTKVIVRVPLQDG
jgi:PAS domain S-box-containing protein